MLCASASGTAELPSACENWLKQLAIGVASHGYHKRAWKLDAMLHEVEILENPTQVRALKDFPRNELKI